MREYLKKHGIYLLVLFIIGILIMYIAGHDTTHLGHDMQFHIPNLQSLSHYLDIFHGKILAPAITEVDGIGYGLYLFYPALPHLVYAFGYQFFSLFSISLLDSVFLMHILLTFVSTFLMYHLSYKFSKNSKIAFLTGLIFIFFPYRLSNYFIRYALNESLSFLFIPLILLGLFYLKEKHYKPFFLCFTLGYIGLLYSHLVISFYFTLFLLPYLLIYRKEIFQKESILSIGKSVLVVTLCFLPFLVTLIEHASLPYLVYQDGYMTSLSLLEQNTLQIRDYFLENVSDWSVTYYVPFMVLILLGISLFYLFLKRKDKNLSFYKVLFLITFLAVLFTLPCFPWKLLPHFFWMIQFPWRLETLLVISVSLLAPLCLREFPYKFVFPILVVFLIGTQISYPLFLNNREYHMEESSITTAYQTGNLHEYYLSSYLDNIDYYTQRGDSLLIEKGSADIRVQESTFPAIKWTVEKAEEGTIIELPRAYYKGYVMRKDGKKVPFHISKQGFLAVEVQDGTYELLYKGTLLQRGSVWFSIIGLTILIGYSLYQKKKLFQRKEKIFT